MEGGHSKTGIPASSLREPGQFPVSRICMDAPDKSTSMYFCQEAKAYREGIFSTTRSRQLRASCALIKTKEYPPRMAGLGLSGNPGELVMRAGAIPCKQDLHGCKSCDESLRFIFFSLRLVSLLSCKHGVFGLLLLSDGCGFLHLSQQAAHCLLRYLLR
jgi:hypothetical protein